MSISLNGTNGITGFPAIYEVATTSATAATGTIDYDVLTNSVVYYTANAAANWVLNIRGAASTSLDSVMIVNQSVSIVFMVTQGTTAYYNTSITIDGVGLTPKWQGGLAPTLGSPSGVDVYSYSILKTAAATFTVFASQTRYA
jgi:dihydropteroate synthase